MANVNDVRDKDVTLVLNDGVERTLKYDLNAMAELEDRYGSVDAAFEMLDKNSIKAVRFILWAGLIHAEPELTEQQVGSLIDVKYLRNLSTKLEEAFSNDMPQAEETGDAAGDASPNA